MESSLKLSYDTLARDVAMEICLGGFRFDEEDLSALLEGMSRKDLDRIRERVLYHCPDFSPVPFRTGNNDYTAFAERESHRWFDGIRSQEDLGLSKPNAVIGDEPFYEDRGKYFLFDGGAVRCCTKATRTVEWGPDGLNFIFEIPFDKVPRAIASLLLSSAGERRMRGQEVDFITYFSLPEGRVDKLRDRGDGKLEFVLDGGDSMPFQAVVQDEPERIIGLLQDELDEQRCRLYNEKASVQNRKELFRSKADILFDSFGQRIVKDFMYDRVELHPVDLPNGTHRYLERDVNDLADNKDKAYYVYNVVDGGGCVQTNINLLSQKELESLISDMDNEMELRTRENALVSGIDIENGPSVVVPMTDIPEGTVVVKSVFLSDDGELMCSGLPGGRADARPVSFPMDWLSDKGVAVVKEFTDAKVRSLLSEYPRPELAKEKAVRKSGKASSRGID